MKEIGFWDYTCPLNGSLETYSKDDYDRLLDDMGEAGFNSFVLCPKWLTTGYRSRFDWLDQMPHVSAIASDNAVIHHALQGARARGFKTWLMVVGNNFVVEKFGAPSSIPAGFGGASAYDLDQPGVAPRILDLYGEIAELFGAEADGLIVELEFCDRDAPHRVPLYNRWAAENNRPDFATVKNIALEPRSYPFIDWRDYTTSRRIEMMRGIEETVRKTGFTGKMSSITELGVGPMCVVGNTNLQMLRDAFPDWALTTYDSGYDRTLNRLATMDFCVHQPHALGFEVQYLTRGVMTFTWPLDGPPMDLRAQWRMSLEDAAQHQPDTLWFMGADACHDGLASSSVRLPQWGFADGLAARRELLQMCRQAAL